MLSLIKKLSIFIIYIPTLCFGSQLFYYFGLFNVSESTVFALGFNNNEITFLGANELLTSLLKALNKTLEFFLEFSIKAFYLLFYPFFTWYWWKPETNEKKKRKIEYLYYSVLNYFQFKTKFYKNQFEEKIISLSSTTYAFLVLFAILGTYYLKFYFRGIDDFNKALAISYHQQMIDNTGKLSNDLITGIGTIEENKEKFHVYNLACGNYKCAGIKVNSLEIKTYLPETYSTVIPKKLIEKAKKEYEDKVSLIPH